MITTNQEHKWLLGSALAKIKDSRTTFLEPQNLEIENYNHGIFIDIFPWDPLPPFSDQQQEVNHLLSKELLIATLYPQWIRDMLNNGQKTMIPLEILINFINLPYKQRGEFFEDFLTKNFSKSDHVGILTCAPLNAPTTDWERIYDTKYLEEVEYLPFENIQVPVPKHYDEILTHIYDEWRKPIFSHVHAMEYSADISYKEYIEARKTLNLSMK